MIQTFGERINVHPRLHLLVTEGGKHEEGFFHKVPSFDDTLIAQFFSREVFSLLLKEGLISLEWVRKILGWRHTGLHAHSKVQGKSKKQVDRIIKYLQLSFMAERPPPAQENKRSIELEATRADIF